MAIINGTPGNDILTGDQSGVPENDEIFGFAGNDTLNGLGGNDALDGGTGNDSMAGGTGDDAYVVDSFSDTVVENPGEGTDTVNTTLSSYSPGANVENVTFTGTGAFSSTGNDLNNRLQGGAGNDNLNGLGGNDTLVGRAGDDMYSVDSIGDVVTELSGEGTDQVWARLSSYTLPDHVEILVANTVGNFTGTGNGLANIVAGLDGNDTLSGLGGNDTLNGSGGDDSLDGGADNDQLMGSMGNDFLDGGTGRDTAVFTAARSEYLIEQVDALIRVTHLNGGLDGIDLLTDVEVLRFSDGDFIPPLPAPTTIRGTNRNDTLTGTAGPNLIQGLKGNDTIDGGAGNDTITAGTGRDLVFGGAGNDEIQGHSGNDTMHGGSGDDTYIVRDRGDQTIEAAGEGFDSVRITGSLRSWTLADNVEELVYTAGSAFTGTGNALDNTITGGSRGDTLNGLAGNDRLNGLEGNDTLDGGAGNDTLDGGAGIDRLLGGLGNDTFVFDGADLGGRSGLIDGGPGFDAFAVTGVATVNTEGARVTGVEAVVVASTDTAAQTVIVNLDEVAAESNNGAGAAANVFLALLGGGSDTLDFTGADWTLTASLPDVAPGTTLPAGTVLLGAAEAAVINGIWGGQAIDPATGLGTAVGLDLYVFAKGAQIVTVWTDAETVI